MTGRETGEPDETGWPWRCLDCGTTIYHDGECCRACWSRRRFDADRPVDPEPERLLDWMREEPLPAYSVKVTAISGVELTLTGVWLRLLTVGLAGLPHLLPRLGW